MALLFLPKPGVCRYHSMMFVHGGQVARRMRGKPWCTSAAWLLAAAGFAAAVHAHEPPPAAPSSSPPPAPSAAQPQANRPDSARRIVRQFTFDEPTNPDPVPDRWFRAQDDPPLRPRPGFPSVYNLAELDRTQGASGPGSARLPTRGGSACLRLSAGEIPVYPDADYSVTAQVRTTDLKHARAFLTARLLDQKLQPIPGSEVRSEPTVSATGWSPVRVVLPGKSPAAAWMQIDLELLQPKQFQTAGLLGEHKVWLEDVQGAAWFDDVTVSLLPRSRFACVPECAMVTAPEQPRLVITARDLGGDALTGRIRVMDIDGQTVLDQTMPLDPGARPAELPLNLPGFGWYRAVLDVSAGASWLSRSELWLSRLPSASAAAESTRSADLDRFGIIADQLPPSALERLPPVLEAARTRFVALPVIDPRAVVRTTPASGDSSERKNGPDGLGGGGAGGGGGGGGARDAAMDRMILDGQQVTLALSGVPAALVSGLSLDPDDALGLCSTDPAGWAPLLESTLDVYGQRIVRYQLGAVGTARIFGAEVAPGVSAFERAVSRLVPGPRIVVPWRADRDFSAVARPPAPAEKDRSAPRIAPGPLIDGLDVLYPASFPASGMVDLARRWDSFLETSPDRKAGIVDLTVIPELPDLDRFGARARAVEIARRMIEFWNAFGETKPDRPPARLALLSPFRLTDDSTGLATQVRLLPGPELGTLVNVADRLAGRRVVGTVPSAPGVKAYILASRRDGALDRGCIVAWNESAAPERAVLEVTPSHEFVTAVDLLGNQHKLRPEAGASGVTVRLDDAPVFLEGVDPYVALFAGSFRLEPSFVPAVATEHEHRISLTNPWPIRITGQLQLKEVDRAGDRSVSGKASGDWTITPNVVDFDIGPGQVLSLPMTLSFGAGQLAGIKDFAIVARVQAEHAYPPIRMLTTVEVGLPELDLVPEVHLSPTPTGPDVVVVAAVTNKDTRARTLMLEMFAKGTAAQQLPISGLPPGQTVARRFVLRNAAQDLAGRRVVISLTDNESAARLNKAVVVP